ncbi:FlhC family transcriptional regulator [Azospirillum sp. SYSU D00513]|uniref:FlhC family transcriptional regulator n=1 Tax=Azospirillum sp. SYSU D00513 TaxID=2812561 RepID=UPI001A974EE8|nr:FlhC family transcriptional regulator [Azospirillum sp. SYSU D00513]
MVEAIVREKLKECETFELMVNLIRRRGRSTVVASITGYSKATVRKLYKDLHDGCSPPSGLLPEPTGIVRTRKDVREASLLMSLYRNEAAVDTETTYDVAALIRAFDAYLIVRTEYDVSPNTCLDINDALILAREMRMESAKMHLCGCGQHFLVVEGQLLKPFCPFCTGQGGTKNRRTKALTQRETADLNQVAEDNVAGCCASVDLDTSSTEPVEDPTAEAEPVDAVISTNIEFTPGTVGTVAADLNTETAAEASTASEVSQAVGFARPANDNVQGESFTQRVVAALNPANAAVGIEPVDAPAIVAAKSASNFARQMIAGGSTRHPSRQRFGFSRLAVSRCSVQRRQIRNPARAFEVGHQPIVTTPRSPELPAATRYLTSARSSPLFGHRMLGNAHPGSWNTVTRCSAADHNPTSVPIASRCSSLVAPLNWRAVDGTASWGDGRGNPWQSKACVTYPARAVPRPFPITPSRMDRRALPLDTLSIRLTG